ncbi:MAG: hypothetical protein B7X06_00340, partial [Verrucomicrobia bacterium 21-51-4]
GLLFSASGVICEGIGPCGAVNPLPVPPLDRGAGDRVLVETAERWQRGLRPQGPQAADRERPALLGEAQHERRIQGRQRRLSELEGRAGHPDGRPDLIRQLVSFLRDPGIAGTEHGVRARSLLLQQMVDRVSDEIAAAPVRRLSRRELRRVRHSAGNEPVNPLAVAMIRERRQAMETQISELEGQAAAPRDQLVVIERLLSFLRMEDVDRDPDIGMRARRLLVQLLCSQGDLRVILRDRQAGELLIVQSLEHLVKYFQKSRHIASQWDIDAFERMLGYLTQIAIDDDLPMAIRELAPQILGWWANHPHWTLALREQCVFSFIKMIEGLDCVDPLRAAVRQAFDRIRTEVSRHSGKTKNNQWAMFLDTVAENLALMGVSTIPHAGPDLALNRFAVLRDEETPL